MVTTLDTKTWAKKQFGDCELGDKRRTKRLSQMAEQIANNPAGSFPDQMERWGDVKAAYRLFDQEDVTFKAVASPHWEATRRQESGRYLILNDTTEIDFGKDRKVKGLGPTGKGTGRGFLLHNGLMVDAENQAVLGLAGQEIHYRKPASKKENSSQRLKRDRESEVWGRLIDQIGPAQGESQFIHVCDRGADNFEVFCHLVANRRDWVIRTCSKHRNILTTNEETTPLSAFLAGLPVVGEYELHVRSRKKEPARTARLEVRIGAIGMPVPRQKSPYVRELRPQPIRMWVVWVREVNAPQRVKPIEWVLYTSLPVKTFEDAWRIIEYYEARWLIEEYHKALKSGCRVTARSLRTPARLEAMAGVLSVVAVRLLQLKSLARTDPDRPVRHVVPPLWLAMLRAARKTRVPAMDLTVGQFYRELAKLGGFLGRRHDGEPGWITIWRGWEKLNILVRGAELGVQLKKCG
jgi:hypothetical protein